MRELPAAFHEVLSTTYIFTLWSSYLHHHLLSLRVIVPAHLCCQIYTAPTVIRVSVQRHTFHSNTMVHLKDQLVPTDFSNSLQLSCTFYDLLKIELTSCSSHRVVEKVDGRHVSWLSDTITVWRPCCASWYTLTKTFVEVLITSYRKVFLHHTYNMMHKSAWHFLSF